MSKERNLILGAIRSTIRSRGLWSGISLIAIFARGGLRSWFGRHHRSVIAAIMVGVSAGGGWLGARLADGISSIRSPADVWWAASLLGLSISALSIGIAHFVLPLNYRRQVWLRSVYALSFALFVGGIGYLGFDHWHRLYGADPASAVLFGLVAMAVIFGFREVVSWFLRSLLIRDMAVGDIADVAALTEAGRWRVSVHEAGHALCYGLCVSVPEDAYVGLDSDLNNLVAGAVSIPSPKDPTEVTKERMEWSMLMTMAGVAAERVFFGESSMCGGGDSQSVNNLAGIYLASGHGEVFVMSPENKLDVDANREAIGRLRDRFAEAAETFVRENKDLCEMLAKEIERVEFLDCEGIAAFTGAVIHPQSWVPVTWPKTIPVIQFPADFKTHQAG